MTSETLTTCDCKLRQAKHQKCNPNCGCLKTYKAPARRAGARIRVYSVKCPTCKINVVRTSSKGKDTPECPPCFEMSLLNRIVDTCGNEFNYVGIK